MNAYARIAASLTVVVLGFGVVQAATVPSSPTPAAPTLADFLDRTVAEPLRERHLGFEVFSRAGPRWDAKQMSIAAISERPDAAGFTTFRVEAPSLRRPGQTETVWFGRVDARRAVELASGRGLPVVADRWQPLADVLKAQAR